MATKIKALSPRATLGCLLLFALPFFAVGVGMTVMNYLALFEHRRMQDWVAVPATITDVRRAGNDLSATYHYTFDNRPFTGERVALKNDAPDDGFRSTAYTELKRHADTHQPFTAFVDPRAPENAILYRQLQWTSLASVTIFGATFGSAGTAFLAAALAGWRGAPRQSTGATPDEPWLSRSDWVARCVLPQTSMYVMPIVLGAVSLWWWIATWPYVSNLPTFFRAASSTWFWATLLYPLLGVAVIAMFLYEAVRARKFGESLFEMADATGILGGQLAGVIRIPATVEAADGFRLRLSCCEEIRSGDDSRTKIHWQDEQHIAITLVDPAGRTTAVPVLFAIPYECAETSVAGANRNVHWELDIAAETTGVNYSSTFDVPVFRTSASRRDFALDGKLLDQYAPAPDADRLFRHARIYREPSPEGGTRIIVPAARNWGTALFVTLVVVALFVGQWLLFRNGVFLLWPILFGLAALVFAWLMLDLWFYRSVVDASPVGLRIRGGLLGIGRVHDLAPADIERFESNEFMSSGKDVWYTLSVVTKAGKSITLAKGIQNKLLERAILGEIESTLGKRAR